MKRVLFTEEQLAQCMLSEIQLSGDEQLSQTKDLKSATQNTIDAAQSQGVDTQKGVSVGFSADSLRTNAGINESVTKKQLKEAKLKYLKENSYSVRKKDLK